MDELNFNSVETIPNLNASAAFQVDSGKVFKEDTDIVPVIVDDTLSYVPWGGDNALPYNILELIESDETLSTCQMFNAEVCYGSGLEYNTDECGPAVKQQVEDFLLDNALPLQALRLLRLGHHPQRRRLQDCALAPQGGLLLPTFTCGQRRRNPPSLVRQLAKCHQQPQGN